MQTGANLADKKFKDMLLKALADEYSRMILTFLMDKPRSVIEISTECKIPMSTAYRRIHELEESGLLQIMGSIISEDGKRYYLYRSKIKAVRTIFGVDSLEVEVIPNDDMAKSAYW
ncbi:MAG: ArsR/SmtB family transcription factor [Nitrososphaerales archaeon]